MWLFQIIFKNKGDNKMKKILAIFLALVTIMSVALVACDKNNGGTTGGNSNDDDDDDIFVTQGNNKDTDTGAKDSDTKDTSGGWKTINQTIYVADLIGVTIRKEASASSVQVGSAKFSESLMAIAYNADTDWYKISYTSSKADNNEAYVKGEWFTEDKGDLEFENCNEVLKVAKDKKVAAYKSPCFSNSDVNRFYLNGVGFLAKDTANGELVKTGVSKSGALWKVSYNGTTYYIGRGTFENFEGYANNGSGLRG